VPIAPPEKKVEKQCYICSKIFYPPPNLVRRAKVCTPTSHECQKKVIERLDGRKKVMPCTAKCCRSRYRASAAISLMDQAIDARKLLTDEEFVRVIRETYKMNGLVGYAIRFIAVTGCRVGETALVRREDARVDEDPPVVKIPTLKRGGRPVRTVDLHDLAFVKELRHVLVACLPGAAIFPIPKRTLQDRWSRMVGALEISKDTGIHVLRHTRASQLVEAGASLTYVRSQLGWSTITMAGIYAHTSKKARQKIMEKMQTVAKVSRSERNKK
jgi:integrase